MKRIKQLLIGMFILAIATGFSNAADLNDGFLGVKWGTDISKLPDYGKIAEKYDVSYYGNSKRTYSLFGEETPYVIFATYENKFYAAYIQVESIEIFSRLKRHISQKYGTPRTTLEVQKQQTIYRWKHEDTKIKLKLFELEGKMRLGFYYSPLANKVNQAQREAFPPLPKSKFPLDEHRLKQAFEVMW